MRNCLFMHLLYYKTETFITDLFIQQNLNLFINKLNCICEVFVELRSVTNKIASF